MIKFACPACNTHITAPDDKGGEVDPCPSCGQLVQVPVLNGYDDPAELRRRRRQREGMRAFLALIRFFLWGLCLAAIVTSVIAFFQEIEHRIDYPAKTSLATQALVWILGAYFTARTFDLSTKSLEELCGRLRGRKRED
jgi:hypothetical protein